MMKNKLNFAQWKKKEIKNEFNEVAKEKKNSLINIKNLHLNSIKLCI